MTTSRQPTWLTEACPEWCGVTHRSDDLPDDRRHYTDWIRSVPLTYAQPVGAHERVLLVYVDQHVTESGPRVVLHEEHCGQPELRLTADEACDLGAALLHARTIVVDGLEPNDPD